MRALRELEKWGLLPVQDPELPNLAAQVAGERVSGSWWEHPKGKEILQAYYELVDHPDVSTARLVSGEVTFVHRRLFGALVAIGRDASPHGLERTERSLWRKIRRYGKARGRRPVAAELERRLLVSGNQLPTETGAYEVELSTWARFARRRKVTMRRRSPDRAREELEQALDAMNAEFGGQGRLPWQT